MVDFYEYSTPELVRLLVTDLKNIESSVAILLRKISRSKSGIDPANHPQIENGIAGNISKSSTFVRLLKVVGRLAPYQSLPKAARILPDAYG